MSRSIVVVTCDKHRWSFEMLVRSMNKFLRTCPVLIVINEDNPADWIKWYRRDLAPLLNNHFVELFTKADFWQPKHEKHLHPLQLTGWVDQQVIKMNIAKHVRTKYYVVLDSKNFFFTPTNTQQIVYPKCERLAWAEPNLKNFAEMICNEFGVPFEGDDMLIRPNITPYIMRTDLVREIIQHFGGPLSFHYWFTDIVRKPEYAGAEFFIYEIYSMKKNMHDEPTGSSNVAAIWRNIQFEQENWPLDKYIEFIIEEQTKRDVRVAGIHKTMFYTFSLENVKHILNGIDCIDLLPAYESPFTGNDYS